MSARALLIAALAAAPARPAAAFSRQVNARWGFDDISVTDKDGSQHSSNWSQGYDASANGPLFVREAGSLDLHGLFTDGFDVGQAVNTPNARRKRLSGSASSALFSERLRQFVHLNPSLSWSQDQQAANSDAPPRLRKTESVGVAGGLSLPRLPSFNVARHAARIRDPSSASPIDEKTFSGSESLGWSPGSWRLGLERHSSSNLDVTGRNPESDSETRQGHVEYQRYDMKRLGLQSLYLRTDLLTSKNQGETRQRDATANMNARSRPFKKGSWQHSLGVADSYFRSGLAGVESNSANTDLLSVKEARWGTLTNSLSGGASQGAGVSHHASEGLAFTETLRKGRLVLSQDLSSNWADSAGGPASRSDAASARVTLAPREGRNVTFGLRAASARQQGGGPSTLSQGGDIVGSFRVTRLLNLLMNYSQDRQRAGDTGVWNISEFASCGLSGQPRQSMTAGVQANASRTRTSQGRSSQYNSASANVNWFATRRLVLDAQFAVSGASMNLGAGLSWTAGRTALRISYARQELSTIRSYRHLNVSLSRSF